jgi:hypothetical protein
MTQEIIQMARDSGMELYGLGKDRARFVHHLEAFAKLVAEAEREECAKVCESYTDKSDSDHESHGYACAKAIRARGQA